MLEAPNTPAPAARFYRLALVEACDRFSLHGVKALLTIYILSVVIPGGIDRVVGLVALRRAIEALSGPTSDLAFASQLYGLYGALSYLMLPIGGMVADRLVSRRRTIVAGALLMTGGHACMTQAALLLVGLALLAVGTGCLKGNLAAEAGLVYPRDDPRRDRAYVSYLGFLNIGAMLGPLLCGLLAQHWGWAYAFGAAAGGMVVALALFLGLPPGPAVPSPRTGPTDRTSSVGRALIAAVAVTLCFCAYEQLTNMVLVWARDRVDLRIGGVVLPPASLAAADGAFTILLVLLGAWGWPRLARYGLEPGSAGKLMLGCLAVAGGYGVLAMLDAAPGARIGPAGPIGVILLLDIGIVLAWPAALALITSAAPTGRIGAFVGIFYLHGFVANLVVGRLGGYYGTMADARFWLIHAGIALAGAGVAATLLRGQGRCCQTGSQATTSSMPASTSA